MPINTVANAVHPPSRMIAPSVFKKRDLESEKFVTSKIYRLPTMAKPRMAKKPVMVMMCFMFGSTIKCKDTEVNPIGDRRTPIIGYPIWSAHDSNRARKCAPEVRLWVAEMIAFKHESAAYISPCG